MKYEKNQYSEGFSIIGLLIAAGFLWWGISGYFPYTIDSWWGLIPIGIGVAIIIDLIRAKVNRRALRKIVRFEYEDYPEATIREISNMTGLSTRDVQAIHLDLVKQGERLGTNYAQNSEVF